MVTFVIADLDHTMEDQSATIQYADSITNECGSKDRTDKYTQAGRPRPGAF
jgi:hypothetical protein